MKTIITALSLALLLTACGSDDAQTDEKVEATAFTDSQRQAITDYFLSDEEPTVLDATWTADKIFKIGVKDDGSRRDGLATYACDRINFDLGGKEQGIWVHIIDYNKLMKTKEWVKLGEAHC